MKKPNVAVIFGGQSSEHEVSCMSAANIISRIDADKYNLLMIGITKEGRWLKADTLAAVKDGSWRQGQAKAVISPDATDRAVIITNADGAVEYRPVDCAFPVLHGLYGEDGTIQGLLELARIPYVGCGVLASAVSMDKLYTKIIVDRLGIRQADYEAVMKAELASPAGLEAVICRVERKFSYPVFVKPSNAGSSKGVSRADNREMLKAGLADAAAEDRKILVEEMIRGRELECAVFADGREIRVSGIGEILAAAEFYDYEAKYHNADSQTVVDPKLPENAGEQIRSYAEKIFAAVDGSGLARVDFFLTADNQVVFNEINTMPGFTAISMYPMLWEARGMQKEELVAGLIEQGLGRFGERE